MTVHRINTPLDVSTVKKLHVGDEVYLSGTVYVARDTAHKRLIEQIIAGQELPFDLHNQIIYYMGPSPAKPGAVIGSAGPTTSSRMDPYTPTLLEHGLRGMIGKGERSEEVRQAIARHGAVYFVAIGGAAALISKSIIKAETIAYPELGAEAVLRLEVKDLFLIVANDSFGEDLFSLEVSKFQE